ncbi:MAG TPA: hypothetical protein DEP36_06830 [Gammaproteobacteria bacterium]|nr:hypothetical protein [Gammaproteobacteria bacterium]HRF45455.1 hypothetical protein [Candidatus Competibacteraceae bacterium]
MPQNTLAREPFSFASGPRSSRQPERINPALLRRMAARMALEARQIERVAQEAMKEVWDESTHLSSLSSFTAQAV